MEDCVECLSKLTGIDVGHTQSHLTLPKIVSVALVVSLVSTSPMSHCLFFIWQQKPVAGDTFCIELG